MSTELQNLLCSCSSACTGGVGNRCVQQKDSYNEYDIGSRYDSDRDEKLLNDWKVLDDDSWDVISSLRQKLYQLAKSEAESATAKESPHSSYTCTNRQPYERDSIVERASNSIDYTPESEFLKKIKRRCQYLQNRLPNIFSALNDCSPEGEVNECQIPCSETDRNHLPRLEECRKQSEHISRPKKPVRRRKHRKRKSNDSGKCMSENDFEPSLKKPNENSCERCWRFASPARSPVNKPDQRFNPNFRKGHSTTDFEKGDGDLEFCEEAEAAIRSEQQNNLPNSELPCAKHTYNTSNRSSQTSPQISPQICIKQNMEDARQMGQSVCPKHRCSVEPPESKCPADQVVLPAFTEHGCPRHRASLQEPANTPRSQNIRSRHMGSLQQHEPSSVRQNFKCPIHESESPQRRSLQQRCPQQLSPQSKSPERTNPQQRSSPLKCSQEKSPQPGTSYDVKHSCRQQEEPSRAILCSNSEKKSRPQSCVSGSKEMSRSPFADDLDVTEYKEICTKSRKQNFTPPSNPCGPCNRAERTKRTCGTCPPDAARTCDDSGRSKMNTTPESGAFTDKKQYEDDNGNGKDKSGSFGNKEVSSKGSYSKSEKKASKLEKKPAKSPTTGDSKKGSKKSGKDKTPKKSPDKSKLTNRGSEKLRAQAGGAAGTCAKSNQFDKAHPIRPCKCPPRIPENEQSCSSQGKGGHTLCCHCDWEETNHPSNNLSQNGKLKNGSQGCSCNPTRRNQPSEAVSPIPKAGTMECPYRAYMNRFGAGRDQGVHGPHQEDRRCSREIHSEISTQELLEYSPRKYFVFYTSSAKEKKENDVQVLVEELAQGCPKNDKASKTKDVTEKMKKINEPPPDSMALRFQKGVSGTCTVPQSSRILYF